MRRFGIVALAVAMLIAWSLPATAKGKPPGDVRQYNAEITFQEDSDGVATTCIESGVEVTRTDERRGRVSHFESEGATLSVQASDLNGNGYLISTGCHGSRVAPEYFRITLEDALEEDGSPTISVAMLWIFDVEAVETTITLKNGRERTETIRTDFRMGGPYENGDFARWDLTTTTTVEGKEVINLHGTGLFNFVHFQSGGHQEIDGDPLFVEVGARTFTLDVTLTET